MNIVTVTCDKDRNQMLLQAESIDKFVKNSIHHVVINDKSSIEEWRELLTPYYKQNILKLYKFDRYQGSGWHTQQSYKLLMSHYINDDYLILDTKNFFIKDYTELTMLGNGKTIHINEKEQFSKANKRYSTYLNSPELSRVFNMGTPFVFRQTLIDLSVIDWFNDQHDILNSEFVLYSYYQKPIDTKVESIQYYQNSVNRPILWLRLLIHRLNPNIKVFGFHREFLERCTSKQLNNVNNFLKSLGFVNRL